MGSSCPNHLGCGPSALPLHTNTESLSCWGGGAVSHPEVGCSGRSIAPASPTGEQGPWVRRKANLSYLIQETCCWAQVPIFILVIHRPTSNSKHWLWKEGSVVNSLKCNVETDHFLQQTIENHSESVLIFLKLGSGMLVSHTFSNSCIFSIFGKGNIR